MAKDQTFFYARFYKDELTKEEAVDTIEKQCIRFSIPDEIQKILERTALNYIVESPEMDLFNQEKLYADIIMCHGLEKKNIALETLRESDLIQS